VKQEEALFEYLLRLGDTDVVLAQRLGEWIGHGPVLEEDIALANIGLDLLGQGRLWLGLAGEVEGAWKGAGRSEDQLAFLRDGGAFRNVQLVEMPNGDFAMTMARQFYFDRAHLLSLQALARSTDARIAEIAAKAAKEVTYHAERSADWVIRLGDGTDESHARRMRSLRCGLHWRDVRRRCRRRTHRCGHCRRRTLREYSPPCGPCRRGDHAAGRPMDARHGAASRARAYEHLGQLLTEMQHL
jgi:1,2-phenylacetyl-CoA epoxidase catalytic subunit